MYCSCLHFNVSRIKLLTQYHVIHCFICPYVCVVKKADAGGRAVYLVGLWLLACQNCGFESRRSLDVCLFVSVMCCQLRQAVHSSRGVLQSVVCLSVIVKPRQ
jgi:hypothetical protein